MATIELNDQQWQDFKQAEYAIIDCYGQNCTGCVLLEPVYDAVADELAEIAFGRIDISSYPGIADTYGISAMPTVLYFRSGELTDQTIGSIDREELLSHVARLLYQ